MVILPTEFVSANAYLPPYTLMIRLDSALMRLDVQMDTLDLTHLEFVWQSVQLLLISTEIALQKFASTPVQYLQSHTMQTILLGFVCQSVQQYPLYSLTTTPKDASLIVLQQVILLTTKLVTALKFVQLFLSKPSQITRLINA